MASELKHLVAESRRHHSFFLDETIARQLAQEKNFISPDRGKPQLQMCFFAGTVSKIIDDNLISVSLDELVSFFSENEVPIPTYLLIPPGLGSPSAVTEVQDAFWSAVNAAKQSRQQTQKIRYASGTPTKQTAEHADAYFLDEETAAEIAKLENRVRLAHPTITGLQICYFDGVTSRDHPVNLIGVKLEDCYDYFLQTRNRLPTSFVGAENTPDELSLIFQETVRKVAIEREQRLQAMRKSWPCAPPTFDAQKPLRVFLAASRLTEVMQYASKNIGKAFESLGHEVIVSVEENELESLHGTHHLQALQEFNPHIIFNINSHSILNATIPESVFNIVWWHDLMPDLEKGTQFEIRDRDYTYSALKQLDPFIERCGVRDIQRQGFCVDTAKFFEDSRSLREDRIVFAGSSYIGHLYDKSQNAAKALLEIKEAFEVGVALDEGFLKPISDKYKLSYEYVFWNLLHFVVRDMSVEWLCEASPLPVEIYGSGWDVNPKVREFHKGYIAHGVDLASLYRTSTYALVTHPFEINSQRLAEVCSSGTIPIVYDCTHSSYEPHWRNELTFYKKKDELIDCLEKRLGDPAPEIGDYFSYLNFTKKMIARIKSDIKKL